MGKLFAYIVLVSGLMILFNVFGMMSFTGTLLDYMGITDLNSKFSTSQFYTTIEWILLSLLVVGGVTFLGSGATISEVSVMAAVSVPLLLFSADMLTIINQTPTGWAKIVMTVIFIPLALGYLLSVIEWARGRD